MRTLPVWLNIKGPFVCQENRFRRMPPIPDDADFSCLAGQARHPVPALGHDARTGSGRSGEIRPGHIDDRAIIP
jgi:hypothetical protein